MPSRTWARKGGDHLAILEWSINAVAHRIRDLGLVPGQTAAIATNNLLKYIVISLALARLGIAHAPITLPAQLTESRSWTAARRATAAHGP